MVDSLIFDSEFIQYVINPYFFLKPSAQICGSAVKKLHIFNLFFIYQYK